MTNVNLRCRCGLEPQGCLCLLTDSDCFEVSGDGETVPFTIDPVISPDLDNLLSCGLASGDGGILAQLPSTLADPPAVSLFKPRDVAIPNNVMTALSWQLERYDTDTMHTSGAATRITFTTAGRYIVFFFGVWQKAPTGGVRVAQIRKNGVDVLCLESKNSGGSSFFIGHTLIVQDNFAAADYIEAMVQHTAGANLYFMSEYGAPVFAAARVA